MTRLNDNNNGSPSGKSNCAGALLCFDRCQSMLIIVKQIEGLEVFERLHATMVNEVAGKGSPP